MSTFYGNNGGRFAAEPPRSAPKQQKKKKKKKKWIVLLVIVLVLIVLYLLAVFSNIPFIKKWREIYIQTAMSTMRHQWLATYFIPSSVIDDVMSRQHDAEAEQIGINSTDPVINPGIQIIPEDRREDLAALPEDQRWFYTTFWELDMDSTEAYLRQHPEAFSGSYYDVEINEAGLDDEGTEIRTIYGEQVLAVNARDRILLIRVKGSTFRGVLAVAKDPEKLHLYPSASIGVVGEVAGSIAQRNNGILAMTGSSFIDDGGVGNGGNMAGYCMCDGVSYGLHFGWSYKRIELHENNWFHVTDAPMEVSADTTDAVEFTPALIVNGEKQDVGEWTSMNPRACIGQNEFGEFLMIVTEGRFLDSPGCSVADCADILLLHKGLTAINLDGGTSAILWYDGEPVTRCSNTSTPEGRYLPNAWVYVRSD